MKLHLIPRIRTGLATAMLLAAFTVTTLAFDSKPIAGTTTPAWSLTHPGTAGFTVASFLPFCHSFNYGSDIPMEASVLPFGRT